LCARGVNLHLRIGRTIPAEPFIAVPAAVTGITHAAAAAVKMIFGLLNSGGKGLVVRLAIASLRQPLGDVAGFIDQATAKHSGGTAEPAGRLAATKGNKFPAPGIVATLTVKLKLEPGVGTGLDGMVGEIFTKMDFAHDAFLNSVIKFDWGNRNFRAKNCILTGQSCKMPDSFESLVLKP
jgi:hypothetical protein